MSLKPSHSTPISSSPAFVTRIEWLPVSEIWRAVSARARFGVAVGDTEPTEFVGRERELGLLVDALATGLGTPEPQVGTPTYAKKIDPGELRIDWTAPVDEIDRLVRLGGAWTTFRGKRMKIHAADVVDDGIVPTALQPEGKGRMSYDDWRNGAQPGDGEWFE